MDFLGQFLAQVWPLVVFIVVMIFLYVVILIWMRRRRQQRVQQQRESLAQKPRQHASPQNVTAEPPPAPTLSAELESSPPLEAVADEEDPLAELYAARAEAQSDAPQPARSSVAVTPAAVSDFHRVADGRIKVKLSTGGETGGRELLSIVRDERDNRLMVLIGGTAYRTVADDPDARRTFKAIMKELSGVILAPDTNPPPAQGSAAAPPAPSSQPVSEAAPHPEPEASVTGEQADEQGEVAEALEAARLLQDEEVLPGDIKIKSMDELDPSYEVGRFGRIKVKQPERVEEISIAEAIEAYLQYKISQAPPFQNRGIHIRQALSGGVAIDVEGKTYDFVDEVADPEVRAFIKQAIEEWQERQQ